VQKKINMDLLLLCATVSYPFLMHLLVIVEQYTIASIYIVIVILLMVLHNFLQGFKKLSLLLVLTFLCVCILLFYQVNLVLYLPPVLIPLVVAVIFAKSLIGDNDAFITNIAKKIRDNDVSKKELKYTRILTFIWAVFLTLIAIEAVIVAFVTDIKTWSYVTNFLNYIAIMVFAVIEYFIRRIILNHIEHPGFIGFIKQLVRVQKNKVQRF